MMVEWVSLLKGSIATEYASRLAVVALATIDAENRPRVRHVICRGIDEQGALWVASDARSDKNSHLHVILSAEIAIYLPTLRRQFRLAGVMPRMEDAAVRASWWSQLPEGTRAMFFWPDPGALRTQGPEAFPATPPSAGIPDSFEPLVLLPQQVDFLDLSPTPHLRRRWWLEGRDEWRCADLNP